LSVQRPGSAVTAGCRLPSLAAERPLRLQLDETAAVARLLLTIPER
jgi:hypothetical protein